MEKEQLTNLPAAEPGEPRVYVNITNPSNGAGFVVGSEVSISAAASYEPGWGLPGDITHLSIALRNGNVLGQVSNSRTLTAVFRSLEQGTYRTYASASAPSASNTSSDVRFKVHGGPGEPFDLRISEPLPDAEYAFGMPIRIHARLRMPEYMNAEKVEFYVEDKVGESVNAPYVFNSNHAFTAGTYMVKARVTMEGGEQRESESVRIHVLNAETGLTMVSPRDGDRFAESQPVPLIVKPIGGEAGDLSYVRFYHGNQLLKTVTQAEPDGTYRFDWAGLDLGRYDTIYAVGFAGGVKKYSSRYVYFDVVNSDNPEGISVLSPIPEQVLQPSEALLLKARLIGGTPGSVSSVRFSVGGEWTEGVSVPSPDGTYEIDWTGDLTAGRHEVSAVATLNGGGEITSDPIYINVTGGVDLITPVHGQQFPESQPVALKAQLAAGLPIGSVDYVQFVYEGTEITRLPGNGTDVYEYNNWVPGPPRRYENVRAIAFMRDGNRYRSVGISIRVI